MKKLIAVVACLISAFALINPSIARADSRLKLSSDRKSVVLGTQAQFTTNNNSVSESDGYDWDYRFQYEIFSTDPSAQISAVWNIYSNYSSCPGSLEESSNYWRYGEMTCTYTFSGIRTVISAPIDWNESDSYLTITVRGEGALQLEVRSWLDLNNNDEINAYEPSSYKTYLDVIDPSTLDIGANLTFSPPTLKDGNLEMLAWLKARAPSKEALLGEDWDSELVNPKSIVVSLESCISGDCSSSNLTGKWIAHPKRLSYEYASSLKTNSSSKKPSDFAHGKYTLKVIYAPYYGGTWLLAEKIFDYSKSEIAQIKASNSVGAPDATQTYSGIKSNTYFRDYSQSNLFGRLSADDHFAAQTIEYVFQLLDGSGKPVANQKAYFYFDISQNYDGITIDGSYYNYANMDDFYLERITDEEGQIRLSISPSKVPGAMNHGEREFSIDAIVNGHKFSEGFFPNLAREIYKFGYVTNNALDVELSPGYRSVKIASITNRYALFTTQANRVKVITKGKNLHITSLRPELGSTSNYAILSKSIPARGYQKLAVRASTPVGELSRCSFITWKNEGASIRSWLSPASTPGKCLDGNLFWVSNSPTKMTKVDGGHPSFGKIDFVAKGNKNDVVKFVLNKRNVAQQVSIDGFKASTARLKKGMNLAQIYLNGNLVYEKKVKK